MSFEFLSGIDELFDSLVPGRDSEVSHRVGNDRYWSSSLARDVEWATPPCDASLAARRMAHCGAESSDPGPCHALSPKTTRCFGFEIVEVFIAAGVVPFLLTLAALVYPSQVLVDNLFDLVLLRISRLGSFSLYHLYLQNAFLPSQSPLFYLARPL